jgi:hypothetical protein
MTAATTPAAERAALIAAVAALPAQLEALVAGLTPAELTTPFLAGEWTVAQNVHHLADSHANAYIRCRLIVTEENPPLRPYKQNAWADLPDASSAEVELSLALLRALHARWVRFWEQLPDDAWPREGAHPEYGQMSLDRLLRTYAGHGEAHLDQIRRTLAAGR